MFAWMLSDLLRLACNLGERSSDGAERRFVPRRLTKLEESRDRSNGDVFQQLSGAGGSFPSCFLLRITGAVNIALCGAPARRRSSQAEVLMIFDLREDRIVYWRTRLEINYPPRPSRFRGVAVPMELDGMRPKYNPAPAVGGRQVPTLRT